MEDKECYCTVANDGVAVCVCKYRPCEKLKRKEQECDNLTSQLDFAVQQKECLEQECESLKSENFAFEELIKMQEELNNRYKQALDEIEKLVNRLKSRTPLFEMEEIAKDTIKILNIINKAKE